ncbi:carbohydrate esterase family 1 protein [Naviculisporaceae sp. PSN 640]
MIIPTLKAILAFAALTSAASLEKITTDFGPNPTNVSFYIYVPDNLPSNPPILVNPHWCHGTASAVFGSSFPAQARKHGFIIIYPETPATPSRSDQCWDVSSRETLTHNGGGDSLGIVSMVRWTIDKYKADKDRVFVTGVSSGAMMTNVLIGAYPDVFAGGSAWAGVPFGCFAPEEGDNKGVYGYWSDACAKGQVRRTGQEWKAIVESAYPGYNNTSVGGVSGGGGWRPKFQTFHGTKDEILDYVNFEEQIKMWTAVLGVSETPALVEEDTPLKGWTKRSFGESGWFEAYSVEGVTHDIRVQPETVIKFFGLDCTSVNGSGCFSWVRGNFSEGLGGC